MPRFFIIAAVLLAGIASASIAAAADRDSILEAIRLIENPREVTTPGPRGELGRYQFRESTWRMHTSRPFAHANIRAAADAVAVLHYEWIKGQLAKAGIEPTPYRIALAWNAGVSAAMSGRAPARAARYAERVINLEQSLSLDR